jgi:hypothetical protein
MEEAIPPPVTTGPSRRAKKTPKSAINVLEAPADSPAMSVYADGSIYIHDPQVADSIRKTVWKHAPKAVSAAYTMVLTPSVKNIIL